MVQTCAGLFPFLTFRESQKHRVEVVTKDFIHSPLILSRETSQTVAQIELNFFPPLYVTKKRFPYILSIPIVLAFQEVLPGV